MINIPATFPKPRKNNVTRLTGDDNKDGELLMNLSSNAVLGIVFKKNSPYHFSGCELEDIISDTYTKAWGGLDSYDPAKGALSTWVNKIAHNLIKDHCERNEHYNSVPYDENTPVPGIGGNNVKNEMFQAFMENLEMTRTEHANQENTGFGLDMTVDKLYDAQELLEFVKECVDKLETKDQDIFKYSLSGHKNKDIAGLMDMTPNAIGIRLHRIREYLKEKLDWYVKEIRG